MLFFSSNLLKLEQTLLTWKMAKKMRKASMMRATMYVKAANVKAIS